MLKIILFTYFLEKTMKVNGLILEEDLKVKIVDVGILQLLENFTRNRLVL